MIYTKNPKKANDICTDDTGSSMQKCSHGIEPLTLADLDDFIKFHEEYLNYGEGVRMHFEQVLKNESTIAFKYMVDGEMAGATVFLEGISLSSGHFDLCNELEALTQGQLTYTGDALFVRKEYQHLGISKRLFNAIVEELRARGVKFVVNELWIHPDGTMPARNIIKAFGEIVYQKEHKNFYKDFYQHGYLCPICGKACICGAQVNLLRVI